MRLGQQVEDVTLCLLICFLDLLLDWKQNANEVIVKLSLGSGALKTEEVETSFTDATCVVKLPGVGDRPAFSPPSPCISEPCLKAERLLPTLMSASLVLRPEPPAESALPEASQNGRERINI